MNVVNKNLSTRNLLVIGAILLVLGKIGGIVGSALGTLGTLVFLIGVVGLRKILSKKRLLIIGGISILFSFFPEPNIQLLAVLTALITIISGLLKQNKKIVV